MSGQSGSKWEKIYDEESAQYYYWNEQTKATQWEKPEDYVEPTSEEPDFSRSFEEPKDQEGTLGFPRETVEIGDELQKEAELKRKAAVGGLYYVLLGGLLLGGTAAVVTYFLFPAAIATIATLIGLTGPLALVVPLVAVGVIGTLFGAAR